MAPGAQYRDHEPGGEGGGYQKAENDHDTRHNVACRGRNQHGQAHRQSGYQDGESEAGRQPVKHEQEVVHIFDVHREQVAPLGLLQDAARRAAASLLHRPNPCRGE